MRRLLSLLHLAALCLPSLSVATFGASDDFFGDEILVRGVDVEVRRPELERAYLQFKANATLRDQVIPPERREELEAMLLDRLVVTELLLKRSTPADREVGIQQAQAFVANVIRDAGSEVAFDRQLIALGFTREDFEKQIRERATCEAVVERELHPQIKVSDAEIQEYYDARQESLRRPDMAQVQHILLTTRDLKTGVQLTEAAKAQKRLQAESLLERARQGEGFAALAREYSEDPESKALGGEVYISRGQPPVEFESAAFSLEPGKISDVVTTPAGYHVIKLVQIIPGEPIPLDQIKDELRLRLTRDRVQSTYLPELLRKLKAEARLEYLNGARPPTEPSVQPKESEL